MLEFFEFAGVQKNATTFAACFVGQFFARVFGLGHRHAAARACNVFDRVIGFAGSRKAGVDFFRPSDPLQLLSFQMIKPHPPTVGAAVNRDRFIGDLGHDVTTFRTVHFSPFIHDSRHVAQEFVSKLPCGRWASTRAWFGPGERIRRWGRRCPGWRGQRRFWRLPPYPWGPLRRRDLS